MNNKILREVVKSKIGTNNYNIFSDDCAQFVQEGLRAINKPIGSMSHKEKSNILLYRATNQLL